MQQKHKLSAIEKVDLLRKQLAKAERAAEIEYMSVESEKTSEIDDESLKEDIKIVSKKQFLSKKQKLLRKRKQERIGKKSRATVQHYLGSHDAVTLKYTSKGKRVFDMKCPKCNEVIKNGFLNKHLEKNHKMSSSEAKLKTSEQRVMYLWAKKNKHGCEKPLPCEMCHTWHLRLGNHLHYKHKNISKADKSAIVMQMRSKHWGTVDDQNKVNTHNSKEVEKGVEANDSLPKIFSKRSMSHKLPSARYSSCSAAKYIPNNAIALTDEDRMKWKISEKDFFHFYYSDADTLLEAFEEDLIANGQNQQQAQQHVMYVEYIWNIVDESKTLFPEHAFSNPICIEDNYHRISYELVGNGGVEANTLRTRFSSLRAFIKFLRRRHIFAGMSRDHFRILEESIEDWNSRLKPLIRQRRIDLRKEKAKQLMTPKHMIAYGRSTFVQKLIKSINDLSESSKSTKRFAVKVRDYLMTDCCLMNGLRASNLIELRLQDVKEATKHPDYPGHWVIVNSTYKTSTIYGEKLIAVPNIVFGHLKKYIDHLRPIFLNESSPYLFIASSTEKKMSHGSIGSGITASFAAANIFSETEYKRVSPTRIRCACATFACNIEGMDSAYFAKHFMKNRKSTTDMHYNLHSNYKSALSLAMMIGNEFEIGGKEVRVKKEEREEITNIILEHSKPANMPSKDTVINWIKAKNNDINSIEMKAINDILDELNDLSSQMGLKPSQFYNGEQLELPDEELVDRRSKRSDDESTDKEEVI